MEDTYPNEGYDLCLQCGGYSDGLYLNEAEPPGFYCEDCLLLNMEEDWEPEPVVPDDEIPL